MSRVDDSTIVSLWQLGRNMTQIAAECGLSRERVRQRLARNGISGRNNACPYTADELLAQVRDANNVGESADRLGVSRVLLEVWIEQLGLSGALASILSEGRSRMRADRDRQARDRIVDVLRDQGARIGETPRVQDLAAFGIYPATLVRYFGSTELAMQAAGLQPRRRGRAAGSGRLRDSHPSSERAAERANVDAVSATTTPATSLPTDEDGIEPMTWHFRRKTPQESVRDPVHEEFFADDAIRDVCEALVREGIQNSLDARVPGSVAPVIVRLGVRSPTAGEAETLDRDTFMSGLAQHWSAGGNGLERAPRAHDAMHWLIFEDFGTTGLTGNPGQDFPENEPNPFFAFFRAEGYSEKQATQRGRWGLGKFAFPRASRGRCFFGLTVRHDDGRRLLMGRCTLKSHRIGDERFTPDGFFGCWSDNQPVMPHEDSELIDRFASAFGLARDEDRAGLSVVVPFVDPSEVTTASLLSSVMRGYWLALLAGDLQVRLVEADGNVFEISADTIDDVLERLPSADATELRPLIELARWGLQREEHDIVQTALPPAAGAPRWNEDIVPPSVVALLQERVALGRWRVRVPVRVRRTHLGGEGLSHFDVFLEKAPDSGSQRPLFIREGIHISDVRARIAPGWRAIVIATDDPIATFLGDSENPAHTRWLKEGTHFKGRYERGADLIAFVTSSAGAIVERISASDRKADPSVLADVLSVLLPDAPERMRRPVTRDRVSPSTTSSVDIERQPQLRRYQLSQVIGGFSISSGNATLEHGTLFGVAIAYDTRTGNPFKQWQEYDFDLSRQQIRVIEQSGVDILERRGNRLKFRVVSPEFRIVMSGFDRFRDLKVDVRVNAEQQQ